MAYVESADTMEQESPDLRKASHIGLWLVVGALVIFLTWSAVNKKSEDNTYRAGSVDNSRIINVYPLGLAPGCDYIRADGTPLSKKTKNVTPDNPLARP